MNEFRALWFEVASWGYFGARLIGLGILLVFALKWWARCKDRGSVWVAFGACVFVVFFVFETAVGNRWIVLGPDRDPVVDLFMTQVELVLRGGGEVLVALGLLRYFLWRPHRDDMID